MSEKTNIAWANHTSSPWFGCTEVDQCCANCYSRDFTRKRFAHFMREAYRKAGVPNWETIDVWGNKAPRVLSRGYWTEIKKWNKAAQSYRYRPRTFTSMIDWLDDMPAGIVNLDGGWDSMIGVVGFYLKTIQETPDLDHLLLTKRVENFWPRLQAVIEHFGKASCNDAFVCWLQDWLDGHPPANVWFGYTAGTREEWIRRHDLSWTVPAHVTWCSCEPMLDDLFMSDILRDEACKTSHNLDWIVLGLESGAKRRRREIQPLINLANDASACGIKVFVKQDEGFSPGQQGRIPPEVWEMKQFPDTSSTRPVPALS